MVDARTPLQSPLRAPSRRDLIRLPTAKDRRLVDGESVWYWRDPSAPVVAAVFDGYGAVRCAVWVSDTKGRHFRRWVSTGNVYAQAPAGSGGIRSDGE